MSDDLAVFLRARLDEDEAVARDAGGDAWDTSDSGVYHADNSHPFAVGTWEYLEDAERAHIGRHDPARVLREVEAKRAILADSLAQQHFLDDGEWYGCAAIAHHPAGQPTGRDCTCGRDEEVERRLRHLAAVYSDHPDYRQEWAP